MKPISLLLSALLVLSLASCESSAPPPDLPDGARQVGTPLAQDYFTGTIDYKYSYRSDKLDVDSLTEARPRTGRMCFGGACYESKFFGRDTSRHYYDGRTNMAFDLDGNNTVIGCEDYGINRDSVLSYEKYASAEKIQEFACEVLEFQGMYALNRYYVTKALILDPRCYQDHAAYNWAFYTEQTNGGLILRVEHEFPDFTMIGVAEKIRFDDNQLTRLEAMQFQCLEMAR